MHVLPLVDQHPGLLKAEMFTIGNFRRAASWVASRAFGVDSHHGAAALTSEAHSCIDVLALTGTPGILTGRVMSQNGKSDVLTLVVQGCLWCHLLTYSITRQLLCGCLMSTPSSQSVSRTLMIQEVTTMQQKRARVLGAGHLAVLVNPHHVVHSPEHHLHASLASLLKQSSVDSRHSQTSSSTLGSKPACSMIASRETPGRSCSDRRGMQMIAMAVLPRAGAASCKGWTMQQ